MTTFQLLANPLLSDNDASFCIKKGVFVRKPNEIELKIIIKWIHKFLEIIVKRNNPFQTSYNDLGDGYIQSVISSYEKVMCGNHKYLIIDSQNDDLSWNELIPMLLTNNRLIRLCKIDYEGNLYKIYNHTFNIIKDMVGDYPYNINTKIDNDFQKQYDEIKIDFCRLSTEYYSVIHNASVKYLNSFVLPKNNYSRIISLFGILELLLINANSKSGTL